MDKKAGPLLALTCLPVTYSGEEHNSTSGPILGRQTKGARRLPQRAVEDEVALSPSHLLIEERPLPHPPCLPHFPDSGAVPSFSFQYSPNELYRKNLGRGKVSLNANTPAKRSTNELFSVCGSIIVTVAISPPRV